MNKGIKIIGILLGLVIVYPIKFYLFFKILKFIEATELMWFLFWVYIPTTILVTIIIHLLEKD